MRAVRKTLLTLAVLSLFGCSSEPSSKRDRFPDTAMSGPIPAAPPPEPEKPKEDKAAVAPLALDVDPVAIGLTAPGITQLCDGSLEKARQLLDQVRALKGAADADLTWDATLGRLDAVALALHNAGDFPQLMAVAHPDEAVREAAKACEPRIDHFTTALYLDADLAAVFKRYAARKEALSAPQARLLEHTLRDYRRNGLELDAPKQARVRELNEKISKISQDFETNIAASTLFIEVTRDQLKGLPDSYIEAHKPGENGKIKIKTDYPDYFPFLQYAADRQAALALYKQFDNRAADKNLPLLDELLKLREEKAKLLGYPTWADYILEPRMAKDAKTVAGFLEGLRQHVAKKGTEELRDFGDMNRKLGGSRDEISISDRSYLEDQVRKAKFGLDSKEVSQYLEIGRVKQGLLDITSKMFGLTYRPIKSPAWHADVEPYEVLDASGKVLGRFYFDLYPRADKEAPNNNTMARPL
jgi:thimet oligopeptidase